VPELLSYDGLYISDDVGEKKCCADERFLIHEGRRSHGEESVARSIIMMRDRRKRIVLIDDHLLVRQGLERLLNASDEFVVCEEAGNAAEGMEMVRDMRPDAVIVDVGLPGPDGIELTEQLLEEFPNLVVLILSMHEEPEYAVRAMQAGAMGYLVKNEAIDTLRTALRDAFSGKRNFSDDVLRQER
jgi:DNA-binding NarL/FixJ family response regulator